MEPVRKNNRAAAGILLIIFGLILVGVNLNIIPHGIRHWIQVWVLTWQMLLIGIGLILLISKENKGPGLLLIFIGGFFLAVDYFDNAYYLHRLFWPSLIILLGFLFLIRGSRASGHWRGRNAISDQDMIDEMAIFGGGQKIITSKNFKGGKITNIFGGSNIDFSQAQLASAINVIDIVALFGGAKLIVPRDWDIVLEVTAIFGGFSDKRIVDNHIVHDPSKKLVVKGFAIFGGGEINYL